MQVLDASPRTQFTRQQIIDLIESDSVSIDIGLELLDRHDEVIDDISDHFLGGQVDYERDSRINKVARLTLTTEITWANQRLRPYMVLKGAGISARFNLGIFIPTTPVKTSGDTVEINVDCYDKLLLLATSVGRSHQVLRNTSYLDAVTTLIEMAGETNIVLDQSGSALTLPSTRVWEASNTNTYLDIINELLEAAGYSSLWVDEEGTFRAEPIAMLADRTAEWIYDATSPTTIVEERLQEEIDYFSIPNRFIFIRDDPAQPFPVEGNGKYTVLNQSDGPTSVDARGRVISKVYKLDAANQTALVLQGNRIMEEEREALSTVRISVSPNPLHGHNDCVLVSEASLEIDGKYEVKRWKLPLGGFQMVLELVS